MRGIYHYLGHQSQLCEGFQRITIVWHDSQCLALHVTFFPSMQLLRGKTSFDGVSGRLTWHINAAEVLGGSQEGIGRLGLPLVLPDDLVGLLERPHLVGRHGDDIYCLFACQESRTQKVPRERLSRARCLHVERRLERSLSKWFAEDQRPALPAAPCPPAARASAAGARRALHWAWKWARQVIQTLQ